MKNSRYETGSYLGASIRSRLSKIVNRVPSTCVVCTGPAIEHNLCKLCLEDLPRLQSVCFRCALPLAQGTLCGPCLLKPPLWQSMTCAAPYSEPFDALISRFKFQGRTEVATALSALMLEALLKPVPTSVFALPNTHVRDRPNVIVPVPLHWTRQWKRGFNQAAILANPVGQKLNLPVVHALSRRRRTRAQTLVKSANRKANLRNAFRIRIPVSGLHIALLDDVVTTGATATSATQTLLKAGASSVRLWACIRASSRHLVWR